MKTVSFNTGRKYTARGQIIVATLHDDGVITFMDHSRMISGEIAASEFHTPESVERHTMRAYDNSAYQESRRSRADGMMRGGCNTEEAFEAAAQAEAEAAAAAQAKAEAAAEPAAADTGLYWFEFDGQLVEPFETLLEAQAVCDEQVDFWLAQDDATRSEELGWADISNDAIRSACNVTFAASN